MSKRIGALDVLKSLVISVLACHHYQWLLRGDYRFRLNLYDGVFYVGPLVELFFLLSGFLALRYKKQIEQGLSFRAFFLRRYLRLLPLCFLSTLCYELLNRIYMYDSFRLTGVVQNLHATESPDVWSTLAIAMGFGTGWGVPDTGVNCAMWYISVLLACYLLLYFATWLAGRLRVSPYTVYAGMVLLGVSLSYHSLETLPLLTSRNGRGMYSFFLGLLLARALEGRRPGRGLLLGSLTVVLGYVLAFCFSYPRALITPGYGYLAVFLVYPALVILGTSAPAQKLFGGGWVRTMGSMSFSVYAWHLAGIVALSILSDLFGFGDWLFSLRGMLVFLLCMWVFAAFSHFCIEKPIARCTDRLLEKL